jgi:hypothetical protein
MDNVKTIDTRTRWRTPPTGSLGGFSDSAAGRFRC